MMFEKMPLIERKWQLDDLEDGDQRHRHHYHGQRIFSPAGPALRDHRGELAQSSRAAEQQKAQ